MDFITLNWNEDAPATCRQGALSIGNFDGVHLGHAALLRETCAVAVAVRGPVLAMTFDPHPMCLLAPARYQLPLTTIADRAAELQKLGVDQVIVLQTTPELLNLGPEAFFQQLLRERLQVRGIVEGFNFRFGKDRLGSNEMLQHLCATNGLQFRTVAPFTRADVPVSSSRVRDALSSGNIAEATILLNRPYHIRGIVGVGARRGRTLGFPTANLDAVPVLMPGEGVYAVAVRVAGTRYAGAANIGPNPTFGENARKVEVHLLDFTGDLYGQEIVVEFLARLRATEKFADIHALKTQLAKDIADARSRFESAR